MSAPTPSSTSAAMPGASADILARLTRLHPKIIDLSLGRIERLLARLGNPERTLPNVVHIAGTNGKGSVAAYLEAMLRASGLRTHLYTSPHLVSFNERIRLDGTDIDDATLIAALEACETANGGAPITFFEITTAAAFLAFRNAPVDAVILETGLGGRLDATNVLEKPLATVITPVALDHQHYLGDTLSAIAGEKAGILKSGVPCVLAHQDADADRVIRSRAMERSVPLVVEGDDFSATAENGKLHFQMTGGVDDLMPLPALAGEHQIQNAGVALATAELLVRAGLPILNAARARGLLGVRWPARLQMLRGRLLRHLPPGSELWLDGGHNPAAGEVIARQASLWSDRPLDLVIGMLNTKDNAGFLRPLAPYARHVRTVSIEGEAAAVDAETLARIAGGVGMDVRPVSGVEEALKSLATASTPGRVLICGSLYLAGRVLAADRTA